MTITFKKQFKDAILSGEKRATIRNSKHYNEGTFFNLNLGTRFKPECIGKARCVYIKKIEVSKFLEVLNCCINDKNFNFYLHEHLGLEFFLTHKTLGFKRIEDAFEFYKEHLKKEFCYLHVFGIVKHEYV